MTTKARKRLKEASFNYKRIKTPNMPEYAIPMYKKTDTTTNGLTACIIDWLTFNGWQAERINTTGRYVDESFTIENAIYTKRIQKGKWIPGTGTKGSADISATIRGRSVKIEVKFGRDTQSDHQIKYQEMIERAGGTYIIAKDFDQFLRWYDNFMLNNS